MNETHDCSFSLNEYQSRGTSKLLACGGVNLQEECLSSNNLFLEFNHKPWLPTMGEFHYSRYPFQYWESYLRIKRLLFFLNEFGHELAPMSTLLPDTDSPMGPEDTTRLRVAVRHRNGSGYIFLNNYQDHVRLPDRKEVTITLALPDRKIEIATESGIDLKEGHSSILPFNLKMEGIKLVYATAQLITRLRLNDKDCHYFFFAPDGIQPEFLFSGSTGQIVAIENAAYREKESGDIHLLVEPGRNSLVTLKSNDARTVKITTLTHEESLDFWIGRLAGRQRVFISDSSMMFAGNSIILRKINHPEMTVAVYPHVTDLHPQHANVDVVSVDSGPYVFQDTLFRTEAYRIEPAVKELSPGKYLITIPKTELKAPISDVFLELTYAGDTACAYLNGRLISDNFNNGTPWFIGMKRFLPDILGTGMVVLVYPAQQQEMEKHDVSEMAAIQAENRKSGVSLNRVSASIEYQLELTCQNRV